MGTEAYKILGFSEHLYHYTSIDAVCGGIITKEGLVFRLTHYAYLNDTKEYDLGREVFSNRLKGAEKEYLEYVKSKPSYILSLSQKQDFLPMWGMYGKNGSGLMLGLSTDDLFNFVGTGLDECKYCNDNFIFDNDEDEAHITACIATYEKIKAKKIYDDVATYHLRRKLDELIPFIKSNYFAYEKEVRLAIKANKNDNISYRSIGNIIVPYITIILPKNILRKIMIGPTLDAKRVEQSLKLYLDDMGYEDVSIEVSHAPYRG